MENVIPFRKLTGLCCPGCNQKMAFDPRTNSIECVTPNCGEGYLRSDGAITITSENGYTIIEAKR